MTGKQRDKQKKQEALFQFQEKVHEYYWNEFSEQQRKENRKSYKNIQRFIEGLMEKEEDGDS